MVCKDLLDYLHPYMEQHVGKPYVYTVDINDQKVLRKTMADIRDLPVITLDVVLHAMELFTLIAQSPKPYLPREFSFEGMIERFVIYLSNQVL